MDLHLFQIHLFLQFLDLYYQIILMKTIHLHLLQNQYRRNRTQAVFHQH
jgi:hypothetical protein